ncbi:MAG: hypothetical protein K2H76_07805, partial [Muribaculaceae bacterium]|nr:hypothetical protein [Muribaculaceae bacterium]
GDLVETTNQIALEVTVEEGTPAAEEPTVPSTFTVTASSAGVKIGTVEELFEMYAPLFEDRDDIAYSFGVKGKTAGDTETVTVEVPEGWDGYIYGITNLSEIMPFSGRKAKAIDWVTIKEYDPEGNMTKGNQVAIPADGKIYMASLYLYKGDKLAANEAVSFMAQIEKDVNSGIAGIEAAETEVRYFNLQGVEVKNPENGVYLKVSNGKVSKIAVK